MISKEQKSNFVRKTEKEVMSFAKESKELFLSANVSENLFQSMNHTLIRKLMSPSHRDEDVESMSFSVIGVFEATIVFWWIHQHGELLREMIDKHQKGYEENANRATDELLGQLGARKNDKGDQQG